MSSFLTAKRSIIIKIAPVVAALLVVLITVLQDNNDDRSMPVARDGVLDLTAWELHTDGNVKLDGDWEFYWGQLLTYEQFQQNGTLSPLQARVPGVWNGISTTRGEKLPGTGYATYRLHIKNGTGKERLLGLHINPLATSYTIWVDGQEVASNGEVGSSPEHTRAEFRPVTAFFSPPAQDFEIIVQIANFQYARGGLWSSINLGTADNILMFHDRLTGKRFFSTGALVIMGLFSFCLYLLRKEGKSSLYFAAVCFLSALVMDVLGQFFIVTLFPGMDFVTLIRIWYLSIAWAPFFLVVFINEIFPTPYARHSNRVFLTVTVLITLFNILAPISISSRDLILGNLLPVAAVLYTLIIAVISARKKTEGSVYYLVGLSIAVITIIHDILSMNNVLAVNLGELMFIGILSLVFAQILMQARIFTASYREKEMLLQRLGSTMAKLKQSVDNERSAELKFLQSQIRPHFIHNALHTIISISRYDAGRARKLLLEFSRYLRGCFDFENLERKVPFEQELNILQAYVSIEQARFGDKLQVEYDIEESSFLLPPLILQPLVENAIVHGLRSKPGGGTILVYTKKRSEKIRIGVRDNGTGMAPEQLAQLHSGRSKFGVGLTNINQRLTKMYQSSLQIESLEGAGTEISMEIPWERVEINA